MLKRFLQQAVVLGFLAVSAGAFIFTMTRIEFPFPEFVTHWSYGMMAPYQGDTSWNADFVYEGQLPDGTWHQIDMDRYMPYLFAEGIVRRYLRVYAYYGPLTQARKFGQFAQLVLKHERERGVPYQAVRVYYEQWDRSPAGYEFLHTPLFTSRDLVTWIQAP